MGSERPPNIVLFMTDQLRRDALSCYGNPICRTPNMDRVAREGARFEQAYCTSPVSSPSRASLMTGLYPHNHGVMINTHIKPAWSRGLAPEVPVFSRILKGAGYALDYVGKWHVHQDRGPKEYGFDRHETPKGRGRPIPESAISIAFPGGSQVAAGTSDAPREEGSTWRHADQGIAWLRERAGGGQPFFLRIDLQGPHFPCVIPEPYATKYDPSAIPPWPNFEETFTGKPAGHLRKHREWHLEDKDWTWWRRVVAHYYVYITLIDDCVGRVLDAMRELGLDENTVFVFATDHGDSMGSHKHFEKAGTMYDEVMRIPLLVKGPPAFVRQKEIPAFVRLLDLMPTFVEWAGARLPAPVDGRSVAGLLRGEETRDWPDSVYAEHHGEVWGYHTQRMVRTNRWKYVYNAHDFDELYDLERDPHEMRNLVDDPSHAAAREEMKARLIGWNDHTRDMLAWNWVRWNFPPPIPPMPVRGGPHGA